MLVHVDLKPGGLILGLASHAAALGVPSLIPPHDFIGRLRAAWLADPDSNPVEIVMEIAGMAAE